MKKITSGELIRKERKKLGLSLSKLAELTGVSQPYISQLENNKRTPSYEVIHKINSVLKIDFHLFAWASGLYSDDEYKSALEQKDFFDKMSPEEEEIYQIEQELEFRRFTEITNYEKYKYINLEDIAGDETRHVFLNGYEISKEDISALKIIFKNKNTNRKYPSFKEIEKEFNKYNDELEQKMTEENERSGIFENIKEDGFKK